MNTRMRLVRESEDLNPKLPNASASHDIPDTVIVYNAIWLS